MLQASAGRNHTESCNKPEPQDAPAGERTGRTARSDMHPKAARRQNAPLDGGSWRRTQTCVSMSTEYQETFLPPQCHKTIVTTTQKSTYHPLKGTSADVNQFRRVKVTKKWIKNPAKPPQPECNQTTPEVKDYTSMYQTTFKAWPVKRQEPFKPLECLSVKQGLSMPNSASKGGRSQKNTAETKCKPAPQEQEPQPIEWTTSYKCNYIQHPVQPRPRKEKPAYKRITALPQDPEVSPKPNNTWDFNQDLLDEASERFKQLRTWTQGIKFHNQGKTKESGAAADPGKSTNHTDFTPHKCQRTKPVLPCLTNIEKSTDPFETTTTMRETYKPWDAPPRLSTACKDYRKKKPSAACKPQPAHGFKLRPPFSLDANPSETAVGNDAQKACPTAVEASFSAFECISNGTEEAQSYLSTSMDHRVTWADDWTHLKEPSKTL